MYMSMQYGFTLVEVMVTITIMTILSAIVVSSFPVVRNQQYLRVTQQELQDSLSRAEQLAFNETRSDECLRTIPDNPEAKRTCSDVGVYIEPGSIVMFADTFDADKNTYNKGKDLVIGRKEIPLNVVLGAATFLFEADPPNIVMYINGRIQSANTPYTLTMSTPTTTSNLHIFAYGQVEKAN